jgi:hypothetical protein
MMRIVKEKCNNNVQTKSVKLSSKDKTVVEKQSNVSRIIREKSVVKNLQDKVHLVIKHHRNAAVHHHHQDLMGAIEAVVTLVAETAAEADEVEDKNIFH